MHYQIKVLRPVSAGGMQVIHADDGDVLTILGEVIGGIVPITTPGRMEVTDGNTQRVVVPPRTVAGLDGRVIEGIIVTPVAVTSEDLLHPRQE